ncbi:MAG: thioredoxin domain-containing protein, partial [Akkermansiaceae bacterium]|nr:thioredoxin domain-containing protein [Akkermansiaceae bacterium]
MKSPWLLRILALAGLFISSYLLYKKLSGQIDSIAGCGGESGCANVLGSRWSQFFGIPVTGFAALMYLATLGATWKPSRPVYAALAICFTGAALWFFGVLIVDLKEFCPWCTAAHIVGLSSAVVLGLGARKMDPKAGNIHLGVVGGVFAVIVLCLGQLVGPTPDTHLVTGGTMEKEDTTSAVHARNENPAPPTTEKDPDTPPQPPKGKGRVVAVFDDNKSYNTETLPHLGPADAPHVIVKYFDYTCGSCLTMHNDLEMVAEKHPGKFCMIVLPVPLSRECNEYFPKPYT